MTEAEERALSALDVSSFFKLNLLESFAYRLLKLCRYRREDYYARRLLERMDNLSPLDRFSRGGLLGMLDAWDISGSISPHMFTMLQGRVQDEKYHVKDEPPRLHGEPL